MAFLGELVFALYLSMPTWAFTAMVSTVLTLGTNMILGGVSGLLHSKPSNSGLLNDFANHSVNVKQSAAYRVVQRGQGLLGGVVAYMAQTLDGGGGPVWPTRPKYLHLVYLYTGHEVQSVDKIYADGVELSFDGSGNETTKFAGALKVEIKKGAPGEPAFPGLISDTASLDADQKWTATDRWDGCCSIHYRLKWDPNVFINGVPEFKALIRGKKLLDPRTGTVAYSENLALHVRDFLSDTLEGLGSPDEEMNDDLFIAAANLSDERVALLAGGTEARYTCNGSYDTSKTPGDILKGMLACGGGKITWVSGKWNLYLGAWRPPTIDPLTDDDFRGAIQYVARMSRRENFNGVKGIFVDKDNNWQPTDFPPVLRASYVADDSGILDTVDCGFWESGEDYRVNDAVALGGYGYVCNVPHTAGSDNKPGDSLHWNDYWTPALEVNWKDVEYPFVISRATAQRLSLMDLKGGRLPGQLTLPAKLTGYKVQPPDVVAITHAHFGWTAKTFELQQGKFVIESDGTPGFDLALRETSADVYAWTTADEQPGTGGGLPVPGPKTEYRIADDSVVVSGPAPITNRGVAIWETGEEAGGMAAKFVWQPMARTSAGPEDLEEYAVDESTGTYFFAPVAYGRRVRIMYE